MIPKFREWDAEREDIIPGKGMSYGKREDSDDAFLIRFDHMEDLDIINKNGSIDRTVMMSTGLKDKNGVEIFEGDVLKIFVLGNQGAIAKVIFKNGMFGIEDDMYGYGYDKGLYSLHQILSLRDAEILGNKYEHPHLLEE